MGNVKSSQKNQHAGLTLRRGTSQGQYFIISLKGDSIQLVNADDLETGIISMIIRTQCIVLKEGWLKSMTYSFKLKKPTKDSLIRLIAKVLMSMYPRGWDPLTPLDTGSKKKGIQVAICFQRRVELEKLPNGLNVTDEEGPCLCLETYNDNFLGFHDVPNMVLNELVSMAHANWTKGVEGVSTAVSSVIADYSTIRHDILDDEDLVGTGLSKYIRMGGVPWKEDADNEKKQKATKKLETALIACLAEEGYKLSMVINVEKSSKVFFFLRSRDIVQQVNVMDKAGAGMGARDSMFEYRPLAKRSKASFLRSFKKRGSLKKRIQASLKRKMTRRQSKGETPWWQQVSTDSGIGEQLGI